MSKLKIAAVVSVLLASGVFGGYTYQAATRNSENLRTKIVAETEDLFTDEYVTDEEVTDAETDEAVTDEETTAEETVAERTTQKDRKTIVITTAPDETSKPETSKKTEAETTKTETNNNKLEILKQELAAEATTTTATSAPAAKDEPELVTEAEKRVEAPVAAEKPVETVRETVKETEPVTTTTPAPVKDEPETEPETEAPAETEPVAEEPEEEPAEENSGYAVQVSDDEYIMLCNVVGHEYGSDWVPVEEKALVVEAVMNRVNSPLYPNTIYDVLTQPYQFSGLEWTLNYGGFTYQVTDSVKAAVDLYLTHPEQFQHGYTSFWGDGSANHFY